MISINKMPLRRLLCTTLYGPLHTGTEAKPLPTYIIIKLQVQTFFAIVDGGWNRVRVYIGVRIV